MDRLPDVMTVEEVAAACRVSPRTIRRWIANGEIATVRLPSGQPRVLRSTVAEFLCPPAELDDERKAA